MQAAVIPPQGNNEVLIGGRLYDIRTLKHPGGSILRYYAGHGDATESFREFHYRSRVAAKRLAQLPSRPAPPTTATTKEELARVAKVQKFSQVFGTLRRELEAEGWFRPSLWHVGLRMAEVVALHVVGAWLMCSPAWIIGLCVLAMAEGRSGWLMHEGGHNSLTGIVAIDKRLQEVFYGFGCGMSAAWWRVQHNKHHCTPQKLKHDVDLDTLPLVAFNAAVISEKRLGPLHRHWIKLQNFLFTPVICTAVALFWQFYLHPRHMLRTQRIVEVMAVACRWVFLASIALAMGVTPGQAAALYVMRSVLSGSYIFTNFALSHTHCPVVGDEADAHWVEYGALHTINITPHWWTNWWMAYLNFQIEHHLFPSMPQYRFVKLAPRVKKMMAECGLPYDCRDYRQAVRDTFGNLKAVGESLQKAKG